MRYIRFGGIPVDEVSTVFFRGDKTEKKEKGVSVYHCAVINGNYHICLPNPTTESAVDTIHGLLLQACSIKNKKVFLVEGNEVGIGSDGEPLIKNVRIIDDVTDRFGYI